MANNEGLARRWMESKHWGGWRVGMVDALTGAVCFSIALDGVPVLIVPDDPLWHPRRFVNALPGLDHPGTRAFLLEDVRKAWGPGSYVDMFALHGGASCIRVLTKNRRHFKTTDTEAEALVAALEAAP